jgi:hypothetical protein
MWAGLKFAGVIDRTPVAARNAAPALPPIAIDNQSQAVINNEPQVNATANPQFTVVIQTQPPPPQPVPSRPEASPKQVRPEPPRDSPPESPGASLPEPIVMSGIVQDSNGRPIRGAAVSIGGRPAIMTDAHGEFSVPGQLSGKWVTVSIRGGPEFEPKRLRILAVEHAAFRLERAR